MMQEEIIIIGKNLTEARYVIKETTENKSSFDWEVN